MDRRNPAGRKRPSDGGGHDGPRHVSLARALSKLGWCSRAEARPLIEAGRVSVDGVTIRDPDHRLEMKRARIAVDGTTLRAAAQVYLMLHKPRGWITTAADDSERSTVYELLPDDLPRVVVVAPLDVDSEGVQLFTNDTRWADRIVDPASGIDRAYHVRLSRPPDDAMVAAMLAGVDAGRGQFLRAKQVQPLDRRDGHWIEIVLEESGARTIRRILERVGLDAAQVAQVVRVAVGPLRLGDLGPGMWRMLTRDEKDALAPAGGDAGGVGGAEHEQGGLAPAARGGSRRRRR